MAGRLSCTEKMMMRMMPAQLWGTETPTTAMALAALSTTRPWRKAATSPSANPSPKARTEEETARMRLFVSASRTSSMTGRRVAMDLPRSPWATRPSHLTYWTAAARGRGPFDRLDLGRLASAYDGRDRIAGARHHQTRSRRPAGSDGQRKRAARSTRCRSPAPPSDADGGEVDEPGLRCTNPHLGESSRVRSRRRRGP
jgi:hypothetical protein